MPSEMGQLFAALYRPDEGVEDRGSILYVPPFGEEMNKSRRMATIQAREFASMGFTVLMLDLYGTGDSAGEFVDARWETWVDNLITGYDWLSERANGPVNVWALRFGALLAVELLRSKSNDRSDAWVILWQPMMSGDVVMTEFLRIELAAKMMSGVSRSANTIDDLRGRLNSGESLEIAGYELHPELANSINAATLSTFQPEGGRYHWMELVRNEPDLMGPESEELVCAWRETGVPVSEHVIVGPRFWATTEITECAELIHSTNAIVARTLVQSVSGGG